MKTIRCCTTTFVKPGFKDSETVILRPDGHGWRFLHTQPVAVVGPEGQSRIALVSLFQRKEEAPVTTSEPESSDGN